MDSKKSFLTIFLLSLFFFSASSVLAVVEENSTGAVEEEKTVNSIVLEGDSTKSGAIKWEVDGYSEKGYNVLASKEADPVYPVREGDKYFYYSNPEDLSATIEAFDGDGIYYVRVCEYIGDACGVYSNQIKIEFEEGVEEAKEDVVCTMEYAPVCGVDGKTYSNGCFLESAGVEKDYDGECSDAKDCGCQADDTPVCGVDGKNYSSECWAKCYGTEVDYEGRCENKNEEKDSAIEKMKQKAKKLKENKLEDILAELKELRNTVREQKNKINHLKKLLEGTEAISEDMQNSINNFITYGVDDNTKNLGEGERAAVMYSFKKAFGKLPENENDLTDAIKIANGRWPSNVDSEAEEKAMTIFETIYKREADMENPKDAAAIKIMAYGLRQRAENRNLNSEKNGIAIFNSIFKKLPTTTEDWNVMQAITYSGASR